MAGSRTRPLRLVAVATLVLAASELACGQEYRQPPEEIVRILETPPTPSVSVSPAGTHSLLIDQVSLPPLADLAAPMLRLAGTRVNPATNGRHGARRFTGLRVVDLETGAESRVALPEQAHLSSPSWSHDGSRFAFTMTYDDGIALWVGETATATAREVTPRHVNGLSGGLSWMAGGNSLLYRAVPEGRGAMPERPRVPRGPVIQESAGGRTAPVRTYQDLLKDSYDEALYDHFFTAQLMRLDLTDGKRTPLGAPGIFLGVSFSPDEQFAFVTRVAQPYSYLLPAFAFPRVMELWKEDGTLHRRFAEKPLRENVPIGGVETGARSVQWRPDRLHTLVWVEALDGGDPRAEATHRDRLMTQTVGDDASREMMRLEQRFRGLSWLETSDFAMVSDYDRDRRWQRTWLTDLSNPDDKRLVWERSTQDRYADPGTPVTKVDTRGRSRVVVENGAVLLRGRGASPEGDRPFLRRMRLDDFQVETLWRCEGEVYESVVAVLEDDGSRWITSRESKTEPPNYHLVSAGGDRRALTSFPDPFPELRKIRKEMVKYERADGLPLSGTLYVPADHTPGTRLPLVVWAYPREYNDPSTAGQVSGSPYRFTRIGGTSQLFMLTQGYAVLDAAAMPVVGPVETANDTFVEQIVAAAKAGIDHCVALGVADPDRVGVGGHSYGAFMTANLLAHSDLFRAGCARSGAYNRTLTPFGFQNEQRTFWEAPMTYFAMSPFMHAPKVDEPLLMIHGQIDNNSGTFPIQSERYYQAVKGNGGTARLVMLPYESHGYRSKESVFHVLAEMVDWFDTHVKNAPPRATGAAGGSP